MKKFFYSILFIFGILLIAGTVFLLTLPDVAKLAEKNPATTSYIKSNYPESFEPNIIWVKNMKIPRFLKDCIRVSEDASFYQHKGYNLEEIEESLKAHFNDGKKLRGASTITQQLVKNLYLTTDRSLTRKIKELLLTIKMEEKLSKVRIFEIYLNVIEFGKGIFGIENAARKLFDKNLEGLTKEECIRMACLIPAPTKYKPYCNSRRYRFKINWLLDTLFKYKYVSRSEYQKIKESIKNG